MTKPSINDVAQLMTDKLNHFIVNKKQCWIHQYKSTTNGYVRLRIQFERKEYSYPAHAVSFVLYKGFIPFDKEVCHTCDTRNCVNPEHLFLDTRKGNLQDMRRKRRGSSRGHPQIDEEEEMLILIWRKEGHTQEQIAKWLGRTQAGVSLALKRMNNV